jgi:hypothetical protein
LVVERMQTLAAKNGYRLSSLVETIVTSPQFLNKRVPEASQATEPKSQSRKAKT